MPYSGRVKPDTYEKYAYVVFDKMFVFELGMDAQVAQCNIFNQAGRAGA